MRLVTDSGEAVRAYDEADAIAARAGNVPTSAHLLLALFSFPNRAQVLLQERRVRIESVQRCLTPAEDEARRTVQRVKDRAHAIASGAGAEEVDCLHVLIAISRMRDTVAYRLLERSGAPLTELRNVAVSYITGPLPRRFRTLPRQEKRATVSPKRPSRASAPAARETRATPPPRRSVSETPPMPSPEPAAAPEPVTPRRAYVSATTARLGPLRLEDVAPALASCSVDLTAQARDGLLDTAIGREREICSIVDILGKRRANNPVLVGPAGVGKTAIVEGLAVKIARGDDDVETLHDRMLVALDTGALVAGTGLRGAFSERLGAIKAEVAAAERNIIVFIDELHTLIGAGTSGEGPQDAANELKSALARGDFPCIGATTADEFKRHVEKDPALQRRFSPIHVDEPSCDEAVLILEGAVSPYAEHHGLDYSLDALHAAVTLSHRFINERKLPDKAFAVVDLAGSRARRRHADRVERLDVAKVISEWSGVPLERLAEADTTRFARAEELLQEKLVGHNHVVAAVGRALQRGFAGFNGARPMGSFLFLGPTGVGKTELVKVLAEFVFGKRDAVLRLDMSEMSEKHAVARLIGAQPGYIGYEEGGQLTEALRKRPFQIVLFDEIEKAHPDVVNLLLQILDEGHLTDTHGRRVSFANTLIVLTSNLGADAMASRGQVGFGASAPTRAEDAAIAAARRALPPELWGRLDERLVFAALTREQVHAVAGMQLHASHEALKEERQVSLEWDDAVVEFLLDHGGYSPETGARGMRQAIQRYVEAPIAEMILAGKIRGATTLRLTPQGERDRLLLTRAGMRRGRGLH